MSKNYKELAVSYSRHRVSCKIALYNEDHTKVLLARYAPGHYGLPGGHLESDEHPDEAAERELFEELGLIPTTPLERRDFWLHKDGKVVLGYITTIPEDTLLTVDPVELASAPWVEIERIRSGEIEVGSYTDFILENQ